MAGRAAILQLSPFSLAGTPRAGLLVGGYPGTVGRAGISPEMAVRLSIAFDTCAESWLNRQLHFDLWHAAG